MASRQHPRRPLLSLGCWLVALAAAGCGADDEPAGAPLPRAAVAELDKQLRSIENRYAFGDGACADIERDNRPAVRRALARLPDSVDPDVRRALRQSFARLFELARRQCDSDKPAPAATAPTPPATPATTAKTTTPPAATATAPVDTAPTDTSDTTSTSKTSPSKTTKRPPTSRQPARPRRDKPNTDSVPQEPSQTDGGSGGTPAPQPGRRRPPQR